MRRCWLLVIKGESEFKFAWVNLFFCCFIYSLLCRFWSSGADGLLSATCRAQIVVGGTTNWDQRAVMTVRERELHQRPRSSILMHFLLAIRQKNTNSNSRKIAEHQIWSSVCHEHRIFRRLHASFRTLKSQSFRFSWNQTSFWNTADCLHLQIESLSHNVWSFNDYHTGFKIRAPS